MMNWGQIIKVWKYAAMMKRSKTNPVLSRRENYSETTESKKHVEISEEMTFEDENTLIEQVKGNLIGQSLNSPAEVLSFIKAFTEAATDAVKFCEVQETKRENIRATRDVYIKRLEVQRDIIIDYLERSFDERRKLFELQFKVVNHALETGDTKQLELSLQSINDLAKSSPFKDLAEIGKVQQALSQEGSTFDI